MTAVSPSGLGADGGGDNVHALLAKDGTHPPDHAGLVGVAENHDVPANGR